MKWIEVFKAGTHTDSAGNKREWTDDDLKTIVEKYNARETPDATEAPIVLGHPKTDDPAFGWIKELKVEAGKLFALPSTVVDEAKEWIAKGMYKKVSIALNPDLSLRHVGLLGAVPPAVKGLAPVKFREVDGWFYIEAWQESTIRRVFSRLRDYLIETLGAEKAEAIIPSYDLDALTPQPKAEVAETAPASGFAQPDAGNGAGSPSGGKGGDMAVKTFTEAEVEQIRADERARAAAAEASAAEAKKQLKEVADGRRRDQIAAFCEKLKADGKFLPAWEKLGIPAFMFALGADEAVTFADNAEKQTPEAWFKAFLASLPKIVEFREVAGQDVVTGDNAGAQLDALARARAAEKKIGYLAAFAEVQRENAELAASLAANLRQ